MAKRKDAEWYKFQEEVCEYFRSLGVYAETNVRIEGDKTHHDIDVLVQTAFLGQNLKWIVEVKRKKSKVNKLEVLGLLKIVEFVGADKGFIVSESGFQKGASDASNNTNVSLKTFSQLKLETKKLLASELLKVYEKRVTLLEARYWSHSKSLRRKYGLRHYLADMHDIDFNAHQVLNTCKSAIADAEKGQYPICLDTIINEKVGDIKAGNLEQLVNWLNLNLNWVDERILLAEIKMQKNGDFSPTLRAPDDEKLTEIRLLWLSMKYILSKNES